MGVCRPRYFWPLIASIFARSWPMNSLSSVSWKASWNYFVILSLSSGLLWSEMYNSVILKMSAIDNPNPEVYSAKVDLLTEEEMVRRTRAENDEKVDDPIDELEGLISLT